MIDTQEILSKINIYNKYAKHISEKNRRENWKEIIDRNKEMHLKKFPNLVNEIEEAYKYVYNKKILPSMRSLQFAGKPIEVNPSRIFNCSYAPLDHYKIFGEAMFLLLGGCGFGYSCQKHHIEKLPPIRKPLKTKRFLIGDSIEGWSESINSLIKSYLIGGAKPIFDFRDIRPKGARLITAGGKAPGPAPLKVCLAKIESILESKKDGEQLKPIECHDIICYIADAVLAGGIRRAACISLFSFDDHEMLHAKHGSWWEENPQRGRANNSIVLVRSKIKKDEFEYIWKNIEDSHAGEPGLFFTNDKDMGGNPCFTGDTIIAVADGRNGVTIEQLANESQGKNEFLVYSGKYSTTSNQIGDTNKFKKWVPEIKKAVAFKTGEKLIMKVILSDGTSFRCTDNHKLALPNGNYIEAKNSLGLELQGFFTYTPITGKKHRYINTFSNAYSKQYRLIWEFKNGPKPENYEIDHLLNNGYDGLDNLQLLSKEDHSKKSALERLGENNGIHKIKDNFNYKNNLSRSSFMENNSNYSGLSDEDLILIGKDCLLKYNKVTLKGCLEINSKFPKSFSKNRFNGSWNDFIKIVKEKKEYISPIVPNYIKWVNNNIDTSIKENPTVVEVSYTGETEDVYDLTVEDNHNFYILTKYDDNFKNSKGILVHNCFEISLKNNSFCNLVEVNVSDINSQEDLNNRVKAASFIATIQASYTDFHFLRPIWKKNSEEEALIGVSMTGISDGEVLQYNIKEASEIVKQENERVANLININKARRTTCVKPSGNSSVVLKTSSGIHSRYAPYYWRRMRIGKNESLYTYLKMYAEEVLEDDSMNKDLAIIKIAIKSPEHAIYRNENVISFLERIKLVHEEWIKTGHRKGANTNNVSATVSIKDDEWKEVGNWLWNNRDSYTGISVLPYDGGTYIQMPYEECTEQDYLDFCNKIKNVWINLDDVVEFDDYTDLSGEVACSNGTCEVK